ncbi:MAG: carboxypeptidase regulatory-like domain-containing protein [Vicinamibacterales bacterium]
MLTLRMVSPMLALAAATACGGSTPASPAAPAGKASDPATVSTIAVTVTFDGEAPKPEMMRLDGDPKCVSENGASERPSEDIILGDGKSLQNVFVYVKSGLGDYAFPMPKEPVVLDQLKCRYTPRVLGIRAGQPLAIRNSDPLLHNVRADGTINQPFNMGHPIQGTTFNRTFATGEVMVPFRCDVHNWMRAWVGVLDHPFYGVTGPTGRVALAGLPPGTYTIEAWHEKLGANTEQITVAAKDAKDVAFTFTR